MKTRQILRVEGVRLGETDGMIVLMLEADTPVILRFWMENRGLVHYRAVNNPYHKSSLLLSEEMQNSLRSSPDFGWYAIFYGSQLLVGTATEPVTISADGIIQCHQAIEAWYSPDKLWHLMARREGLKLVPIRD